MVIKGLALRNLCCMFNLLHEQDSPLGGAAAQTPAENTAYSTNEHTAHTVTLEGHSKQKPDNPERSVEEYLKNRSESLVPDKDPNGLVLVQLSLLVAFSAIFPSVRLRNREKKIKTLNLLLAVIGPPASGKGQANCVVPLFDDIKKAVQSTFTLTAPFKDAPAANPVIAGNVTKTRLFDHLYVNAAAKCPSFMYASETSTILSSLDGAHGGFRDLIRCAAENEPLDLSRKTDTVDRSIAFPYLSMLLAGTQNQATGMYELNSGTFSRFLYHTMDYNSELKEYQVIAEEDNKPEDTSKQMSTEFLSVFSYYRSVQIELRPDKRTTLLYNAFSKEVDQELTESMKEDKNMGYRYIFNILKIAGIYALLRIWLSRASEVYKGPVVIEITPDDWNNAEQYEMQLREHFVRVYAFMKKEPKVLYQPLLDALPDSFSAAEGCKKIAEVKNVSSTQSKEWLKRLLSNKLIEKVAHGHYRKV